MPYGQCPMPNVYNNTLKDFFEIKTEEKTKEKQQKYFHRICY